MSEIEQLQARLKEAESVIDLIDGLISLSEYWDFQEALRQYQQKYKDKE